MPLTTLGQKWSEVAHQLIVLKLSPTRLHVDMLLAIGQKQESGAARRSLGQQEGSSR